MKAFGHHQRGYNIMKTTKKIVALFILGLLLLPFGMKMVQASEESDTYNVEITYVFDGENDNIDASLSNRAYGSTFGLTPVSAYPGYTWAYWIVNGVVRTDLPQNHTFRVNSNLVLQGVFAPEGKHTVVFLDSNGQLIDSQFVDPNGTVTLPNVDHLTKPGLVVSSTTPWRTASGQAFNSATLITSNMVIRLQYETTVVDTYMMTVNGLEQGPYNYNQLVTVTANPSDVSEQPFSHWEEDGFTVSRDLEYVFTAVKNRTLTAVYQAEPEADLPLVVLTRDIEKRSGYHTYLGQFYVPEGYDIVEYGFLIAEDNTLELTKDNADYVVPAATHTESSHEFVMSFPLESHFNVRAYFTYKLGSNVLTVVSAINPKYIKDSFYETGFENSSKGSYAAGDVEIDGLSVNLTDALIGTLEADRKVGLKSLRITASGFIKTNTPIEYLQEITFSVATYGTDGNATGFVHVSIDEINWIDVTDALPSGININSTTLTEHTITLIDSANYQNSGLSLSTPLYVRISKTGGNRVNLDELSFVTLYTSSTSLVTLNTEGNLESILVRTSVIMSQPLNPTKTGYTFNGWYLEETFDTIYTFDTPVENDFTLYAKFDINQYAISFESNGGSSVTTLEQDYDTVVTKPTDPTKTGYTFGNWYTDEALTSLYTFSTMPAENITLYASWNLVTYDINYILDGGTNGANPASYNIESSTITLVDPSKTDYIFGGWYDNSEFTGTAVTEIPQGSTGEINLYAKFTEDTGVTYNVLVYDFVGEGNQLLYTLVVPAGGLAEEPAEPTREGYGFTGWFLEGSETAYDWSTPVNESITLFGHWVEQFTVTFESNGGSLVDSQVVNSGSYALSPTPPTKFGYSFEGWFFDDTTFLNLFVFNEETIASNITIYAKWLLVETIVYQTGFESAEGFAPSTSYNNTTVEFEGSVGQQWGFYYGTPSTTGPISGSQSAQMRWYTSASGNLGYIYTNFNTSNVKSIDFDALNTSGNNVSVSISVDGGTSYIEVQTFTLGTSSSTYTYNVDELYQNQDIRVRFQLVPGTTNGSRVTIDNVKFYYSHPE